MPQKQRILSKKQLRYYLDNIHPNTLRVWLNVKYYEELKPFGYEKTDKVFKGQLLIYICTKFCIQLDDL